MIGSFARLARRFALMLGGEVVQSAFHFGFNIALVQLLPVRDYGIFATVLLAGGLALTYMRALVGTPASLFIPAALGRRAALGLDVAFGSAALALSLLVGLGVALALHFWIGAGALAGGAFVGLWSLRSYLRTAFFARQQQIEAGASDFVYTLSGGLLALTLLRGGDLLQGALTVLALANAFAIAAALALSRRRIRISFGRGMRARLARLAPQLGWSSLGVTTSNIQAQGQVLLVVLLAGPAGYAPIAAMLVLFAPLRLLGGALANMMQPEIATLLARGERERIRRMLPLWTLAVLAASVAYGVATLLALPLLRAPVFYGQPLVPLWLMALMVSAVPQLYVMPRVTLEVARSFRSLASMATLSAMAGVGASALLLAAATPVWSLLGSVLSELMVLAWCWSAALPAIARRAPSFTSVPLAKGLPT